MIELAPMLDYTDSFFRQMMREITHHVVLYTEMIAEQAIVKGNSNRLLFFTPREQPLVLQIGGSNPEWMKIAAEKATDKGFKEININAGCPSKRVQAGKFGACLMKEPKLIAECIEEMKKVSDLPISVKTRIALETLDDHSDGFDDCVNFIKTINKAGCSKIIIHARKAKLQGMTPKENRQKLSLNYPLVYRIKELFPDISILINGNIKSIEEIQKHFQYVDGVMIGRWAYANPYAFSSFDSTFYKDNHPILSRTEIVEHLMPILEKETSPLHLTRHMMGLFYQTPYSKEWKKTLLKNDVFPLKEFIKKSLL